MAPRSPARSSRIGPCCRPPAGQRPRGAGHSGVGPGPHTAAGPRGELNDLLSTSNAQVAPLVSQSGRGQRCRESRRRGHREGEAGQGSTRGLAWLSRQPGLCWRPPLRGAEERACFGYYGDEFPWLPEGTSPQREKPGAAGETCGSQDLGWGTGAGVGGGRAARGPSVWELRGTGTPGSTDLGLQPPLVPRGCCYLGVAGRSITRPHLATVHL